jgi:hypothetical protein
VLNPMKEMIGLPLIDDCLLEVNNRLSPAQGNLASEPEARCRQRHRELDAGCGRPGALTHDPPLAAGRLTVLREALCSLLLRRRAEVVQADVVSGDSGQQLPLRWRSILACVPARIVLVGINRFPWWHP